MLRNPLPAIFFATALLAVSVFAGCGRNPSQGKSEKARTALDTILESWSRGEPAEKFADPSQPIQITDPDWQTGYRLLSFLTAETKPTADRPDHFRCRVALSLKSPQGQIEDKEVVYAVQVGERTVIGRETPK